MKKLIIVCEEKYRSIGAYISQLISSNDDTEETTVGTKDGEVQATVWTEKEYKSNSMQISSEQYILFVGNSKDIKMQSSNMKSIFSEYEMKYASLGKQAVLCVEKAVSLKEYPGFLKYAEKYRDEIKKLLDEKELVKIFVGTAFLGVLGNALSWFAYNKKINEIKEQQYGCLASKFYLEELSNFLGL